MSVEEDLRKELEQMREDLERAAGDFPVPIPEPGTDMAVILSANVLLRKENERLKKQVADSHEDKKRWRMYEREYVLPCFGWAEAAGIDLEGLVRDHPGKNCVEHLVTVLCEERDEARTNLVEASKIWDGPETSDWLEGVRKEAAHQVSRWGTTHDGGKDPFDWFWLLGYLAQKAASAAVAGDLEKAQHHTVSTGAALFNWHAHLSGRYLQVRPGIEPPAHEEELDSKTLEAFLTPPVSVGDEEFNTYLQLQAGDTNDDS